MKKKERIKSISLQEGKYLEKEFVTYQEMAEHSPDWSIYCNYQLEPNGMDGSYKVLELSNMQVSHSNMVGGFMFSFEAPKNNVCFSIIQEVEGRACFEFMKLKPGMIIIFDDRKVYNFMSSASIKLIDVSINKSVASPLIKSLLNAQQMYFVDTDGMLAHILLEIIERYSDISDKALLYEIEKKVITSMLNSIKDQEPTVPKCTKGEYIALEIRDQIFKHMDGTLNTITLAEQYQVTTQTLQNSFKSLFGYTPQLLLRLLKLNLVHHELYESNVRESTVLAVANKWGFNHLGRFSGYYKALFGEVPSVTLKKVDHDDDGMRMGCVERKEDIVVL